MVIYLKQCILLPRYSLKDNYKEPRYNVNVPHVITHWKSIGNC